MTCVSPAPGVIVCMGPRGPYMRALRPCPTKTGRIRRMVVSYGGLYFGDDVTCLGCGDKWGEEGRYRRPFRRAWRTAAIEHATAMWRAAVPVAEYHAIVNAELAAYMESS